MDRRTGGGAILSLHFPANLIQVTGYHHPVRNQFQAKGE
jgi:hypothetical protein